MLCIASGLCPAQDLTLNSNEHFVLPPTAAQDRNEYVQAMQRFRSQSRQVLEQQPAVFQSSAPSFTCCMVMLFDTDLYDPNTNTWQIKTYLEKKEQQLEPIDLLIPWHGYPRLGADPRNQFDFWRDLPGGVEGMKDFITICHQKGVRVILPYNPWDGGTRREDRSDYDLLADLVGQTGADGVFLDTLSAGSVELKDALNRTGRDLEVITEGLPSLEQLPLINGSWGQWLTTDLTPGIARLKWIEPRLPLYGIRRWDRDRSEEIAAAFFNGSGIIVWENVFGTSNPWTPADRRLWKKANRILHRYSYLIKRGQWEPFVPVLQSDLYANSWMDEDKTLVVLIHQGKDPERKALIEIPHREGQDYYDLWSAERINPSLEKGNAILHGSIDRLGCILSIRQSAVTDQFLSFLQQQKEQDPAAAEENVCLPAVCLDIGCRTPITLDHTPPEGMVFVPGADFTMRIKHQRRECGCYLDRPVDTPLDFGHGLPFDAEYPQVIHQDIEHTIPVSVKPFYIDQTEVTNRQFQEFLTVGGYRPKHPENFLKHWPDGKMPPDLADHPVVYVCLEDAKAYAQWCGKRLPTEAEWQLAAQGTDGRAWPWGAQFDPAKCNSDGRGTMPAQSLPEGKSPFGCYHMSGNVWEWTAADYSDGHTRFAMIRGGSFYKPEGSVWYMDGGPQPCGHHAKFILTWPGLDRCSTIGFRCVKDAH